MFPVMLPASLLGTFLLSGKSFFHLRVLSFFKRSMTVRSSLYFESMQTAEKPAIPGSQGIDESWFPPSPRDCPLSG